MRRHETNADLRERITRLGLFDWMVARKIGISPSTFCIWLREELPEEDPRRRMILRALEDAEGGNDGGTINESNGHTRMDLR